MLSLCPQIQYIFIDAQTNRCERLVEGNMRRCPSVLIVVPGRGFFQSAAEALYPIIFPVYIHCADADTHEISVQNIGAVPVRIHPGLHSGLRRSIAGSDIFAHGPA